MTQSLQPIQRGRCPSQIMNNFIGGAIQDNFAVRIKFLQTPAHQSLCFLIDQMDNCFNIFDNHALTHQISTLYPEHGCFRPQCYQCIAKAYRKNELDKSRFRLHNEQNQDALAFLENSVQLMCGCVAAKIDVEAFLLANKLCQRCNKHLPTTLTKTLALSNHLSCHQKQSDSPVCVLITIPEIGNIKLTIQAPMIVAILALIAFKAFR